ncbi:cytochrome b5-like heme/steroid binding domain-containing protein [Aspergillus insuetus]
MMQEAELALGEVAAHNSKRDLYLVIGKSVFDCSSFIDEHPGGEEVLLDLAGQDATEAFEDVGHSDEARELLEGLRIAKLKDSVRIRTPQPLTSNKAQGLTTTIMAL